MYLSNRNEMYTVTQHTYVLLKTCWILLKIEVVFQDKIVIKISAILCQDLTRLLSLLFLLLLLALLTEKKRK